MNHNQDLSPREQRADYYKKLTLRNTLINIILFISPFLLLFFIINLQMSNLLKTQIYNHLSETVDANTKTISIFLEDREMELKSLSHLDIEGLEEASKFIPVFNAFIEENRWYDFILIADLEGNIQFSVHYDIQGSIADREYFRVSKSGRFFSTGIFYSDLLDKPIMVLSQPLLDKRGAISGILAAALDLENFYNLLFDLRKAETSELFLIDAEGILLSPTKLGGRPLEDIAFSEGIINPHTGEEGVKTHFDYRGEKVLCSYKKLPGAPFYLVSEMYLEEALLPVKKVNRFIFFVFMPFFILLIIMSNYHSRRVTALLQKLTRDLESALGEARHKKEEADTYNLELNEKIKESAKLTADLRASEEYIRNLMDSISLGVLGLDCDGRISHVNKKFQDMFDKDDLKIGEDIFTALPILAEDPIQNAFEQAVLTQKPQRLEHSEIDRGKGKEYFNLSFFPIQIGDGPVTGFTLLIDNITGKKKLREQLAEYEKLSALSQLAMGAAHEINNPLLGISSFLELLRDETEVQKEKDELEFVLENVYRISETIRGLLNFARPTPPQFTKTNINNLIEETLSFLSHQPIFRKITMTKRLLPSLSHITADLNQIRQVLINMFINAAQSMPDGGTLTVDTQKVKFKDFILINITDTGIGIPKENLSQLFTPFFTTKRQKGTGLGLSISLSYIKNHNGSISVQSEEGSGTIFSITLPLRQRGRKDTSDEETIT